MLDPNGRKEVVRAVRALNMAEGITVVDNIHYVERGYEQFEYKLSELGARIEKVCSEKDIQKFTLKVS